MCLCGQLPSAWVDKSCIAWSVVVFFTRDIKVTSIKFLEKIKLCTLSWEKKKACSIFFKWINNPIGRAFENKCCYFLVLCFSPSWRCRGGAVWFIVTSLHLTLYEVLSHSFSQQFEGWSSTIRDPGSVGSGSLFPSLRSFQLWLSAMPSRVIWGIGLSEWYLYLMGS